MLKECLTIGGTADTFACDARRLAIRGNDSPGGGSATEMDEELTDEERANRETFEDESDGDDDGSRRSSRQDKAYDELKSDRDKLKNDLEAQKRLNQEFQERLVKIEGEKSSRQETNERTNVNLERSKLRAREMVSEISKIPNDDPERAVKIYESMFSKLYDDLPKAAEEISQRTARETFNRERQMDKDQSEARRITLEALEDAGLDEGDYELVEALAIAKGSTDPGWFKRVPEDEQISTLVGMVKERIVKTKRSSREFQDEKATHRRPMDGVIEKGTQRRSVRDQDDDDSKPGPGSILADMARAKAAKVQSTKVMLRQADSSR